jgi:hypothetical protein
MFAGSDSGSTIPKGNAYFICVCLPFAVLVIEPWTLHILGKHSANELHSLAAEYGFK